MLSLYKLEVFNTVAMEGSFSKAAERLLLTQPAVSQHIRDLEASLGVVLFARGNRGVALTPAGETLLDYTRCILRLLAEAESAVADVDQLLGDQIAIGATHSVGVYLLPEWIRVFHQRFAGLTVSLRTDTTPQIAQEILANRLDVGFIEGELDLGPPLHTLPLSEIELHLVVGVGHPWWEQMQVPLESLNGADFIARPVGSQTRTWLDQVFSQQGVFPRVVAEFDHPEAIKQAVLSGMGAAVLPDWSLQGDDARLRLRSLSLQGVDLRRTLKLIWNGDSSLKPVTRAFLSSLAEQFPQIAQWVAADRHAEFNLPRRETYRASRPASLGACAVDSQTVERRRVSH